MPQIQFEYSEIDTRDNWVITIGGTRAYLNRFTDRKVGDTDLASESADSHFMIQRVMGALLVSGAGLFEKEAMGRVVYHAVGEKFHLTHLTDVEPFDMHSEAGIAKYFSAGDFVDWLKFLCTHLFARRAIDDLHLGLINHIEAFVFFYRGFEWIKTTLKIDWDELAEEIGTTKKKMTDLKKMANVDSGVRHASKTGKKMRAEPITYGTWACGLLDAINAARARIDPKYKRMAPKLVADRLKISIPFLPYK